MKTTSELMATIAECHAKVSPMIADEQWVDSDGNIYQIDRKNNEYLIKYIQRVIGWDN